MLFSFALANASTMPAIRAAEFPSGKSESRKGTRALFFPQKQAATQRFRGYALPPQLGIPFLQEEVISVAGFATASSREDRSIPITLPLPLPMIEVNEEMSASGEAAD